MTIDKSISLDRSNKIYQYGRVPFRVYMRILDTSQSVMTSGFPRIFVVDDMEYELPGYDSIWNNWVFIVAMVVVGVVM